MLSEASLNPYYGSFSGVDMVVQFLFPGSAPIAVGKASTISYSTFREVAPVRTLGRISEKGLSKGPRTIAGSMIMTLIERSMTNDIRRSVPAIKNINKPIKTDELPPFDILISFGNEYGTGAKLVIYGVHIIDDGMILSSQDLYTENTFTYRARDIELVDGPWTSDMKVEGSVKLMDATEKLGIFNFNTLSAAVDEADRLAAIKAYQEAQIQAQAELASRAGLITATTNYPPAPRYTGADGGSYSYDPTKDIAPITPGANEATVLVQIRNDDGDPVQYANVTMMIGSSQTNRTAANSDALGQIAFNHIPDGTTVTVNLSGDLSTARTITVSGGETFDMTFTITKPNRYKYYPEGSYLAEPNYIDPFTHFAEDVFSKCEATMKLTEGVFTEDISRLGYSIHWDVIVVRESRSPKYNISYIGTGDTQLGLAGDGSAYSIPGSIDIAGLRDWMKVKFFNPFSDYNVPAEAQITVWATLMQPSSTTLTCIGPVKTAWHFVVNAS